MTHFSDLPSSLANGTLTCCMGCGRLAIMGQAKGEIQGPDEWKCGSCGATTESPVRDKPKKGEQG
mgnify:CR=1 FL=1